MLWEQGAAGFLRCLVAMIGCTMALRPLTPTKTPIR
jgi:hypothetical protein